MRKVIPVILGLCGFVLTGVLPLLLLLSIASDYARDAARGSTYAAMPTSASAYSSNLSGTPTAQH